MFGNLLPRRFLYDRRAGRGWPRAARWISLAALICIAVVARGQEPQRPPADQQAQKPQQSQPPAKPATPPKPTAGVMPPVIPATTPQQEQAVLNPQGACLQPAPGIEWQEYNGPLAKTVGLFARKLDRPTVESANFKPGNVFCTLTVKGKFLLFVGETLDPVTFITAAFSGGIDQAENNDPQFGQGAAGYGKRFSADFADQASGYFFGSFLYPTIFREDPRYYRLGRGGTGHRLFHAVAHIVVAHGDQGGRMPNYADWFATVSTASLSNLYHPGNRRGFDATAESVGWGFASQAGFLVLREFWPEIARKFKLPFRGEQQTTN
ncbi:MAG TPA: hypothetical protein VMJ93_16760 [Verrucomicrobiae bacterium]|nr:hypothetical protein [Verrucomicrobiae bacterium]